MGLNQLTGTPWHVDKFTRAEGDNRRHRTRCTHYSDRGTSYCSLYGERCHGTAHCVYYEDRKAQPESEGQKKDDAHAEKISNKKNNASEVFLVGCKVHHFKYGNGRVVKAEGDNLTVIFYDFGKKELKASVCLANRYLIRKPD